MSSGPRGTAELMRAGRLEEIDTEHVAEEIEALGKRGRWAVHSQMLKLLLRQVKRKIQPERESASWRRSIINSQERIAVRTNDSPSLARFLEEQLQDIYARGVRGAWFETGIQPANLPEQCPFTLDQLLRKFDLDWPRETGR